MIGPLSDALARLTMRPALMPRLEVTRLEVEMPGLPSDLDGLCMAQVSDLHVGLAPWEPMRLAEAAESIRMAGPDLLVNTGDYFKGEPNLERVAERARLLLLNQPPGQDAPINLTVLGNHDYYAGEERTQKLAAALSAMGVKVLMNEQVVVTIHSAELTIAGLDAQQPGFEDALQTLRDTMPPRVVLIHAPDLAQRIPAGSAELILAGHTHGGQIRIPFLSGPIVRRFCGSQYAQRRYIVNDMPLYVNRGLGCTGIPIRFSARPEVTIIRLRATDVAFAATRFRILG